MAGGLLLLSACNKVSNHSEPDKTYLEPQLTIEKRVEHLLSQMTLEEKLSQFQSGVNMVEDGGYGVGGFGFMSKHYGPAQSAEEYNRYQKSQIENTRLGIPALRSAEGIFAYMGNGSTSFPVPLGIAASFDTELSEKVANTLAREIKPRGCRIVLGPVVNLTRDPRWGRTNETYGEDPFLSGQMGGAFVRGMKSEGMMTMMKHFVANMGLDGQFTGPVSFSERLLREQYFPAFQACVDEGVSSVMMAYNTLDGIPCATNRWLMEDILRKEWGFEGTISTDGGSAQFIFDELGLYEDSVQFAADMMNAGIDKSSPPAFFGEPLRKALEQGLVSQERLDQSVARLLKRKFEYGLFDDPYADAELAEKQNNSPEHRALSLEAAKKSMVLLKNNQQSLPWSKDIKEIAVLGPMSDWLLIGHYGGYGREEVTVLDGIRQCLPNANIRHHNGVEMQYFALPAISPKHFNGKIKGAYFDNESLHGEPKFIREESQIAYDWGAGAPEGLPHDQFSVRWTGQIKAPKTGEFTLGVTADDGIRLYLNNELVIDGWEGGSRRLFEHKRWFKKGEIVDFKLEYMEQEFNAYAQLGWDLDLTQNLPVALKEAQQAEAIVAVMGSFENENADRAKLELPMEQVQMIRALAKLEKPLVVVLQSPTVIAMEEWIDEVDAVLMAWYPGCEGGNAVAQTLFGDYNPAGKLPLTFPKTTGQVPLNYNRTPKGKAAIRFLGDYNEPLFPFGHGLSYSTFEFSNLVIKNKQISQGEDFHCQLKITNTSARDGEEVVQLYVHDRLASVAQPIKKLVAFERVSVASGQSKLIDFKISAEQLKIWNHEMNFVAEPGHFDLFIGASSEDIRIRESFELVEKGA
ncbi:beta-glucosidase [Persicobacter diffluens]|uniref:Beta-glucosidase n=2 Tax=Persicobacter diffluens TaxID=981 RepID=A0AAN4W2X8_9BACT|nr:beta-glucosidase [Persicobacter diffluens]